MREKEAASHRVEVGGRGGAPDACQSDAGVLAREPCRQVNRAESEKDSVEIGHGDEYKNRLVVST